MSEITKKQKILMLQDGIEFWIDEERANMLIKMMEGQSFDTMIHFDGRHFTKSMVRGIFDPRDMEEKTRRKNRQWKCTRAGNWHDQNEKCSCATLQESARAKEIADAIAQCHRGCNGGWITFDLDNIMRKCECIAKFDNQ